MTSITNAQPEIGGKLFHWSGITCLPICFPINLWFLGGFQERLQETRQFIDPGGVGQAKLNYSSQKLKKEGLISNLFFALFKTQTKQPIFFNHFLKHSCEWSHFRKRIEPFCSNQKFKQSLNSWQCLLRVWKKRLDFWYNKWICEI